MTTTTVCGPLDERSLVSKLDQNTDGCAMIDDNDGFKKMTFSLSVPRRGLHFPQFTHFITHSLLRCPLSFFSPLCLF